MEHEQDWDACQRCGKAAAPLIETDEDSDVWVCLACVRPHELAPYGDIIDKIILDGSP